MKLLKQIIKNRQIKKALKNQQQKREKRLEQMRANSKRIRELDSEAFNQKRREYTFKNRAKIREQHKKWRNLNTDKLRQYYKNQKRAGTK